MAVIGPKLQLNRTWVYPPILAELATVGLEDIGVYIALRQNMYVQYNTTRPIVDLCLAAERRLRMLILHRWWEHPDLDILGIRVAHAAAEMGEETGAKVSEICIY